MFRSPAEEIAAEQALHWPGRQLKFRLDPAVPTPEEVGLLLRVAASIKYSYYVILRLLYASGLRLAELAALRWGDVLWDHCTLFIRCGKGERDRYVLVDSETLRHLRQLRALQKKPGTVIGVKEITVRWMVRRCADASGLYAHYLQRGEGLSTHSLRHAFATHCYENGLDYFILSRLLGHQYVSTTAIYTLSARRQAQAAYAASNPARSRTHLVPPAEPPDPPLALYDLEFCREFSTQMKLATTATDELPALLTLQEVRELLDLAQASPRDLLLVEVLYYTGMFLVELLALRGEDLGHEEQRLWVGLDPVKRPLYIKPQLLERLRVWASPQPPGARLFDLDEGQAEALLAGYAHDTGLAQRLADIGRCFSSHSLRTAFASHRLSRGMREISLMHQLGHQCYDSVSTYSRTAVTRWLPAYTACHELNLRPQLFDGGL